jgi:hypothetical protein
MRSAQPVPTALHKDRRHGPWHLPLARRGARLGRKPKPTPLAFVEGGWHPGNCERWVEVRDDLSLSLLQASLIELNRPIRVVVEGG